jgi:hypothetical protein
MEDPCYCRSFLRYIHIKRRAKLYHQTIGETMLQPDSFWHEVKPPRAGRNGRRPQTSQDIAKATGCCLKPDGKALLPKTACMYVCMYVCMYHITKHWEVKLVPKQKFHQSWCWRTLYTTEGERELSRSPATNPTTYSSDLHAKYTGAAVAQTLNG